MLCIVELACLVLGIIILATGRVPLSATREVRGGPAYVIGLLLLAVFPIAFGIGFVIGFQQGMKGQPVQIGQFQRMALLIDIGAILVGVVPALIIALATARPKRRQRRRLAE